MNSFQKLQTLFFTHLSNVINIPAEIANVSQFELNTDKDKESFGDINANIAMICAQKLKQNPRAIAQKIIETFQHPFVLKIEIAGPGFLNFFLSDTFFSQIASEIDDQKEKFFQTINNADKKINIEFVSANPTGPMHIGHGRNGILGDVLGNILTFQHQAVTKEFYINDAGAQITKLGASFKIRCLQQLGEKIELPEDAYHGIYLKELASICTAEFKENMKLQPDHFFENYAKQHLLKQLETTLENYGIIFDVWFSEKSLHDSGQVKDAIEKLIASGHTFENEGALWFRSTTFGDDKDRVLKKANGELTYVAADVAYLINKLNRGFDSLIMVLGHDHHSYKIRLEAIMQALGYDKNRLIVILYQLVHLFKDGQPVKMSKRTGNMITLQEVIEETGKNVARFFFLNRKADAELQFDLNLALSQSNENPIFYIQYAYVRTHSIQARAQQENIQATFNKNHIYSHFEKLLIKKMCSLKQLLVNISEHHQIHLLAYFTYELSTLFHQYYNQQRVIDQKNIDESAHRLFLVQTVQTTLKTSLFLMGITPVEKM